MLLWKNLFPNPRTATTATSRQSALQSTELSKRDTGNTLYILDEPTTGLHFEDIRVLMSVLQRLVDKGNTVIVIEHNLELICEADYVIDLGPGAGTAGGNIVAQGTVRQLSRAKSPTAPFIKAELER